uniref:Uncharacterized protein n=1 Tax=Oryza nivara TaxID=4536 RepID=A0A0E0FZA8_ORYNI
MGSSPPRRRRHPPRPRRIPPRRGGRRPPSPPPHRGRAPLLPPSHLCPGRHARLQHFQLLLAIVVDVSRRMASRPSISTPTRASRRGRPGGDVHGGAGLPDTQRHHREVS